MSMMCFGSISAGYKASIQNDYPQVAEIRVIIYLTVSDGCLQEFPSFKDRELGMPVSSAISPDVGSSPSQMRILTKHI
jgi:hypothetical protein